MSFGTVGKFQSKKAFAEEVLREGAAVVTAFDTSMFDNKGTVTVTVTVESLADTSAVIVGPDVYSDRRWYANVRRNKKTGTVRIV